MSTSTQTIWHNILEHVNVQTNRCENLSSSNVDCLQSVCISDGLLVHNCPFAVKISQISFVVAPSTTQHY